MIRFFVVGTPAPQGSKKAVPVKGGRTVLIETNDARKKAWRTEVADAIAGWKEAHPDEVAACPLTGPLFLSVTFYFHRPASVSVKKRPYPTVKPDVDKVVRSIMDCLKINGLIGDDALVIDLHAKKRYRVGGGRIGADVLVTEFE